MKMNELVLTELMDTHQLLCERSDSLMDARKQLHDRELELVRVREAAYAKVQGKNIEINAKDQQISSLIADMAAKDNQVLELDGLVGAMHRTLIGRNEYVAQLEQRIQNMAPEKQFKVIYRSSLPHRYRDELQLVIENVISANGFTQIHVTSP